MDSPETAKSTPSATAKITIPSSLSDSVVVQDSPVFCYINNLSPIKPFKAGPVAQGFTGLNSPPLVFTSPRVSIHSQSSFLRRAELSHRDGKGKNIFKMEDKSETPLTTDLTPCTEKEHDSEDLVHDQACSLSGCVDELLSDLVMDCAESKSPDNLCLNKSDDSPQMLNGLTDSNRSITNQDKKSDTENDAMMAIAAPPAILDQAEDQSREKPSFILKPSEMTGEKQTGVDLESSLCRKDKSDFCENNAFEVQHCESQASEIPGAGCKPELDCSPQLLMDSVQIVEELEYCGVTTETISKESVESIMVIQHQRGMRRRCLQFEEAQSRASNFGSCSPASREDSEVPEASHLDLPKTPSLRKMINITSPHIVPMSSSHGREDLSLKVARPSGIGLHLNSILTAIPVGCTTNGIMKSTEKGHVSVKEKKLISIVSSHQSNNIKCSVSLNGNNNIDNCDKSQNLLPLNSATSLSPNSAKTLGNSSAMNQEKHQELPGHKRKSNSNLADGSEDFSQSSPKKRRKKASGTVDGDGDGDDDGNGCKRCNCKKTKCLKLYCDCFAAGIYCAEPCACQGCFNRPEYEDTVLETRQLIESRNPLAFAPKVVQRATEPSVQNRRDDINLSTPSSARHKRGCNCKKSMCQKKYCECYQANVGCSNGCRCEGCKNVYGRKEEYGMNRIIVNKHAVLERLEGSLNKEPEMVATRNGLLETERSNPHSFTPLTPSFQCSDHGNDASESRFLSGRLFPSPESNLTFVASNGKQQGYHGNSEDNDVILETSQAIPNIVSFDEELDCINLEAVDEFTPRCHEHGSLDNVTAGPNPPSLMMTSWTSPKTRDPSVGLRDQFCSGAGQYSGAGSLRWRSSPMTPLTQFGGSKVLQVLDSDNRLSDIQEDETPEILKDTSTSPCSVKVSSPNKKRVSPPQSHLHEVGSCSSAGLRTGRKFILRAVPSFPPLTPCINSKSCSSLHTSDPQDFRAENE